MPTPPKKPSPFAARFKRDVVDASKPAGAFVLVKYSAEWCAPCRTFAPILERVLKDWPQVTLQVYDIDRPALAQHMIKQNISAVPTLHLYAKGKRIATVAGAMTRRELTTLLEQHCG